MTTYQQIEDYIEMLCVKHKKLRHGVSGRAFTGLHFADENFGANQLKPIYLRIEDCAAQSNRDQLQWTVELLILKNVPSAGVGAKRVEVITQASDETLEIAQDFDARIRRDYEEECLFIKGLLGSTIEPIGVLDQQAYGWKLTIRFRLEEPTYNINAWEV
jgi:hypothetical protein